MLDGHLRLALLDQLYRRVDLKIEARFGRLLRPLAWKQKGSIQKEVSK